MKYLIPIILLLSGCSIPKDQTCYELTLNFTGVNSKQILCTNKPLKESYNFRKLEGKSK